VRCIVGGAVPTVEDSVSLPAAAAAVTAAPLLQINGIAKMFQRGGFLRHDGEWAVKHVSFSVAAGEFVGIVGESGSGKSTLGRLIMGLERPTAGEILLDGGLLGHGEADWRRRIGSIQLVFQDPRSALNPRSSVLRLVTQPVRDRDTKDLRERAVELLRDTGLPRDVAARIPSQLSGGQRQRVNIARALCASPRLLIADEIASGLDVLVQAQILNLLLRLRREHGIALLMISHDLSVVRYLCDRVIVMCKGEVVEAGTVEQVFAAPVHPYTRELIAAVPPEDPSVPWAPIEKAS
jgi:peptide/nickel transport system ATP-binding protein